MNFHDNRFPGESEEYRDARNDLLKAEIDLRNNIEKVASLRRNLPKGGKLKEDYEFEELVNGNVEKIKFSELFSNEKKSLIVYSFMYPVDAKEACNGCTSILDGLDGNAPDIRDKINFVVIAKSPIEKIHAWATKRGWHNLRLLSSNKNSYNKDYFGEFSEEQQMPSVNVFVKEDEIYHFWNSEMLFSKAEDGQHPRHADLLWPVWNMFDLTPEGRGNWFPKFNYDK